MQSFSVGDQVVVTSYAGKTDSEYVGKVGPIKKILRLKEGGELRYFVDIDEPGFFFWDLICYEGEFEHAKEETNE
jgi:hypothetical protein